jgi:ABC-type oligopeptide transport system substrate-binding subunit
MEVQTLDLGLVWDRFTAGDFEAVLHHHQAGPEAQRRDFGKNNRIGYQNPEMVRLTDQAVATADPDELDRIYRALTEILRADLPVTRLLPWVDTSFAHRRVRGPDTSFLARPDKYMEDLWLENEP